MNPVSPVALALLVLVALVIGLVVGLAIARGRSREQLDAAVAQAGNAAQLELAKLQERLAAAEQQLALLRAERDQARRAADTQRDELDASRDERARLGERASRVGALEAELVQLGEKLRVATDERLRAATSEAQKHQQAASLAEGTTRLEGELSAERRAREAAEAQLAKLAEELTELRTRTDAERAHADEKLKMLDDAKRALGDQFKSLANDILEEKAKRFTEQNQANLGTLLDPLRTQLSEFKGKVEEVYVQEGKDRSALSEQVRQLMELNQTLSRDATNLTNALKGSSKTQGNWGELILERVLEASGLRKGFEYHVQDSQLSEDGRRQQPDVVIDLPGERKLVVDAKVSLVAYDRFTAATTDDERGAHVRLHLESVRTHVKGLSEKRYQALYGLKSLDMVVMFVPIEPAFMLAVTSDESLFMEAWQRNVLLVSPSTLLFVVRTIAHLWRQEAQSRNAQDIARRGAELYDRLANFVGDLQKVGAKLKDAQSAYDDAEKRLSVGKGNVIRQAEMLKALGVKATKGLPAALVDASGAGDDDMPAAAPETGALPLFDTPDPEGPSIQ